MAEPFAVDPETVRAHARAVETVAEDVKAARNKAASVDVAGGAFGVLCGFLVAPAQYFTSTATNSIKEAASLLDRAASELRGFASDSETFEQDTAQAVTAIEQRIPQ